MKEEFVTKESAVKDVRVMAERMAFLHFAFCDTLEKELGREKADVIIKKSIEEYGKLAADAVMDTLAEKGMKPELLNYKYGNDLPSIGWEFGPVQMPADKPAGKISKITYCPLAATWKKLGKDGIRLGRYYCYIDQMKYKAYGPGYPCYHDKNILEGDDCCIIRCEYGDSEA